MKNTHIVLTVIFTLSLLVFSSQVLAQDVHEDPLVENYTTTPLVQPTLEDFAPSPEPEVGPDGLPQELAPFGVNGYFEVSDKQKVFNLTPRYRFNESWAFKLRLPWVMEQTRTYWNGDVSTGGLGDIALDGEYTHSFSTASQLMRLQASVKMPTGDHEKEVEDGGNLVKVPLGSGSWDIMLRGQYTRSTKKSGLLASAMFRKNGSGESVYQTETAPDLYNTETITTSLGNEFVASVFGRYMVGTGWWINLGTSLQMTGDGTQESMIQYANGTPDWDSGEMDLNFKSTLWDLFPGISYSLGAITPYIGARIPLTTSYDNDLRLEERDTVFIVQFTYSPMKMVD